MSLSPFGTKTLVTGPVMSIRAITSSGLPFFLGSTRQMGLFGIQDFVPSTTLSLFDVTLGIAVDIV